MILKKCFFLSLIACFNFALNAQAAFEDLLLDKTKQMSKQFGFSEEFLDALQNCQPLTDTRLEMGVETVYEIKGYDDKNRCLLKTFAQKNGFTVTMQCAFDKTDLELFTESQRSIKKSMAEATSVEEILNNEDYLTATAMMLDEERCQATRSAYDPTKELRQKLADCEPYELNITDENTNISMQVVGNQDGRCRYVVRQMRKAPPAEDLKKLLGEDRYEKIKNIMKDQTISLQCSLTENSKKKYIELLKKTAVEEGNAYDFEVLTQMQHAHGEAAKFLNSLPECEMSLNR